MKAKTIRTQFFIYIGLFSTAFLIILSIGVYASYFTALKENETEYRIQLSSKTKQNVEFFLNLVNNTSSVLSSDEKIIQKLADIPTTEGEEAVEINQNEINQLLQNTVTVQEYISGIYVLGFNDEFYTSDWGVKEDPLRELYTEILSEPIRVDEFYFIGSKMNYHMYSDAGVISTIRPITQPHTDQVIGMIIIDMNYTYLQEMFMASWMQYEEKVLVLNHLGETMFSFPYNINLDSIITDNPAIIESQTTQLTTDVFGKESIILSDTLNFSGWKVVRIINSEHIYEKTNQLAPLALMALGILFILTWMISLILSHSFTKPIRELHQHILKVENGNFKTMIPIKRKDELGQLAHSFNVMTQNLNALIQKMLIEEKEKSQMEFQILQSQINPHFLYNTLDSIKWLATIQNVDNIKDMTNSLINLLKYNISSKGTMVMLKEEIQSIVNYVEIQKYRFGDIFEVYYDIPSQLENLFILRFILQPIIENSIIHGFEDIGNSQFHITIKAFTKDDILFIVITDNGKGMDDVAIETLFTTEDKRNVMHSGIGLKNIHDRIQLYFGPEFGLKISSLSNQGTSIQLSLRVLYKPDNQ